MTEKVKKEEKNDGLLQISVRAATDNPARQIQDMLEYN